MEVGSMSMARRLGVEGGRSGGSTGPGGARGAGLRARATEGLDADCDLVK